MKKFKIFLAALLSMGSVGIVHAADPTVYGLTQVGWSCVPARDKTACTPPGEPTLLDVYNMRKRPSSMLVMIFEAARPTFIGSENLIRADLYTGQACPVAGKLVPYKFEMLGVGYFSCHHFEREVEL